MPSLRRIAESDIADVLALNDRNVSLLASMDEDRLRELEAIADRFDVVDLDGEVAGFVVTFRAGTTYDSENYRWFGDRYGEDFYYLDRIVVHERFRRRGLASFVYDEIEAVAKTYHRLTLEVNLVPPNEASLAFHHGRGYVEVGRRGDETKTVSLMQKEL
jgi:predicted GNAT superfamily acetyltransferase